jgi:hypothetical protein
MIYLRYLLECIKVHQVATCFTSARDVQQYMKIYTSLNIKLIANHGMSYFIFMVLKTDFSLSDTLKKSDMLSTT